MTITQRRIEDSLDLVLSRVRALGSLWTQGGNQLAHALRTAELLRRHQGDAILVVAGLVHDIGKVANVDQHDQIGAEWLHGHVHPDVLWLVRWHVVAQRIGQVPEPLGSQLRGHPRFHDLQALIAADTQPGQVDPLPPLEAFYGATRSVIIGPEATGDVLRS